MEESKSFKYDIFLSFSSTDAEVAKEIRHKLEACDIKVFWSDVSQREKMSQSWFDKIEGDLESSQHLAFLITSDSYDIGSVWARKEYKAFLTSSFENGTRQVIPILDEQIEKSDLPLFIRDPQPFILSDPEAIERLGVSIRSKSLRTEQRRLKNDQSSSSNPDEKKAATIRTHEFGSFMDPKDGQIYKTVKIGNQIWFAENLNLETKKSIVYKHKVELSALYGRLYSWEDALESCPEGWRIPDYYDWDELISGHGGYENAGEALIHSESRKSQPVWSNTDKNSGFSVRYGGICINEGAFGYLKRQAYFWSYNKADIIEAWGYSVYRHHNAVKRVTYDKRDFLSVRCIQDK